jgi:chaperonin GroES
MNVKPIHDRLLVQRTEEATTTKGGIIIPDSAKEKPLEGIVVAVGNGKLPRGRAAAAHRRSRSATACCSASTPAPRSRWTATTMLILREDEVLGVIEN